MTDKEKEIQKHMKTLGLTREEAEQLWLEDNSDYVSPEMAEMEKKAKEDKRRYEKSDKARKPSTKERKVDDEKKMVLDTLVPILQTIATVTAVKTETEVTFSIGANEYTLKLTKHRPKKE